MNNETIALRRFFIVVFIFFLGQLIVSSLVFSDLHIYLNHILPETMILRIAPGIRHSFSSILPLQKGDDAVRFVTNQFWGFVVSSALAIFFSIYSALIYFNARSIVEPIAFEGFESKSVADALLDEEIIPQKLDMTIAQRLGIFIAPVLFALIFFFVPLASAPGPGTSYSKAFQGSLFGASVVNLFWGLTFLMMLRFCIRKAIAKNKSPKNGGAK